MQVRSDRTNRVHAWSSKHRRKMIRLKPFEEALAIMYFEINLGRVTTFKVWNNAVQNETVLRPAASAVVSNTYSEVCSQAP